MVETEEKKVNIPLSKEAHTKAKIISTLKKIKLKDYLREIVEEAIQKDEIILKKHFKDLIK